jgi:hypothetical protein
MAVNKVEYGDAVLLDLTGDTVSADTLLKGASAHDASGEVIDGAVDLNNYYTKEETDALIPDTSGFATTGYVNQQIGGIDFSPYATKAEIPSVDGLATEAFVNAAVEAGQQDLSGYAKKSDIPSLNGYATQTYVGEQIAANKQDLSIYALKTEIPSTSGLATTKYVDDEIAEVTAVANGKCASYVFDTVADLDSWLGNSTNTAKLKTGDVFLIRAVNVPDYWWDGSAKQILETTKVPIDEYAKTVDVPNIKVNNAAAADTANSALYANGYLIVVAGSAPPAGYDSKIITFVV